MAEERMRLPGSSYEELTKIIKGYGACRGPSGPSDVAQRIKMARTTVSDNNAFLAGSGIVHGDKKKELTESGRKLASALDFEQPDDIRRTWYDVVAGNELFEKIVSAVRIRKGMEPSSLRAHIAYTAGEAKSKRSNTGAGTVIEILVAAGLIRESDGKYVAAMDSTGTAQTICADYNAQELADSQSARPGPFTPLASVARDNSSTSVQIQIQIHCSAEDIDELTPRITQLISAIRNQTNQQPD